jgi:fructose-1,6-bisphosphatase/inositol monophosphatase family enzyme
MAQRKKRGAARKATLKRGRTSKREVRKRTAKRVPAKTTPKKRVTKTKAKRAVTKKARTRAPGPPPQQGDAAAETVIVDVIEEPVSGVTVVTEFEATRVQGSEEEE